ncbi:MAG: endonuclease [Deltaproteobacteria bacterium]|nr:endonuclease [Deltaproteobacteria bacterium]
MRLHRRKERRRFGLNKEHTWPQSLGAGSEPARSDLYNLFPTRSDVNSSRGNSPFGVVVRVDRLWDDASGSKVGGDADGLRVFEPRLVHKGNVARAMFYFSIVYSLAIDSKQEVSLRSWHRLDPVDEAELARADKIAAKYQKNRNPFIDIPAFVDRISDF